MIELLKREAHVDTLVIAYKGTGPALTDLMSGQIQLLADPMLSSLPQAQGGRIKALAITSLKRQPAAPDIPTVEESGLPGFEFVSWYGLWGPKDLPADITAKLQTSVAKVFGPARGQGATDHARLRGDRFDAGLFRYIHRQRNRQVRQDHSRRQHQSRIALVVPVTAGYLARNAAIWPARWVIWVKALIWPFGPTSVPLSTDVPAAAILCIVSCTSGS